MASAVDDFRMSFFGRQNSNMDNLLTDIPAKIPEEIFETLLTSPNLIVERIVSLGHSSPDNFWYDQNENEWVLLLKGAARLLFENVNEAFEMLPGSFINIPAHQRHRVEWTKPDEPTVWLASHYGS